MTEPRATYRARWIKPERSAGLSKSYGSHWADHLEAEDFESVDFVTDPTDADRRARQLCIEHQARVVLWVVEHDAFEELDRFVGSYVP